MSQNITTIIRLKEPELEDYAELYPSRFEDEVVYWADSEKMDLTMEEYALGRLAWANSEWCIERIIMRNGEPIGTVTARDIQWKKGVCTLGIVIAKSQYWGMGLGTRALKQFFIQLYAIGIKYIILETYANNTRARRCFEGLGFRKKRSFYAPSTGRFIVEMQLKLEAPRPIGYVHKG